LGDSTVQIIVVECRDRLAYFGVEYIEAILAASGRRLAVLDESDAKDDLEKNMIEVLTSFCIRLYGQRSARNRALNALTAAQKDPE